MFSYLVQSTADPAVADLGAYSQQVFSQLLGVDIMFVFRVIAIWLFVVWVVFSLWVAIDASARYKKAYSPILWFLFVLPFNIIGFIGYLFMRPVTTLEEKQWTKLEGKYLLQELSTVNDCPKCGMVVPTSSNFCAACGTQTNINCPKCESLQSVYHIYCGNCGEKLQVEGEAVSIAEQVLKKPSFVSRFKNYMAAVSSKLKDKFKKKDAVLVDDKKAEQKKDSDKKKKA